MKKADKDVDAIMWQIDINELVERTKCRATGKVRFGSKVEATFFIHWLHWRYRRWLSRKDGERTRKRWGRKPTARYTYGCAYCKGYHITRQSPWDHERRVYKED
ncbi:hypothetical protein G5B00_04775 [Parapedobacter sp. SGR-10]|uniref:hypothetical protein n=1 Tax=Parapedobacter sp. SGR-10 TaxID=2710879 RepID=UPI0013D4EA05|nr:hypothetical protein [Parapedobacter sp. SGR-10]NGF55820.1 hypothetical protein [Parapedobacter sp. SGR-10]